jgi:hypothetical protein
VVKAGLLAAAVLLGACGQAVDAAPRTTLVPPVQSTPQPTLTPYVVNRLGLEALITTTTNKNFAAGGVQGRATLTTCVQDSDALHFICNIDIVGNPVARALTVKATCDSTGNCVWRPE